MKTDKDVRLKLRKFKVSVLIVPTNLDVMFGAKEERLDIEIEGYTLKDAKRRAGIR